MIVVPTHPPHFHHALELLASAHADEPITFVFSSEADADAFRKLTTARYESLVIAPNGGQPIGEKKLGALRELYTLAPYLAVVDDECHFLQLTSPHLESVYQNGLICNPSVDGERLMREHLQMLGVKDFPQPENLYPWFNQIPVYRSSDIPEFLAWFDATGCVTSFEFLAYYAWRVLRGDTVKVLPKEAYHGLIESGDTTYLKETNWVAGNATGDNLLMRFHLDRVRG